MALTWKPITKYGKITAQGFAQGRSYVNLITTDGTASNPFYFVTHFAIGTNELNTSEAPVTLHPRIFLRMGQGSNYGSGGGGYDMIFDYGNDQTYNSQVSALYSRSVHTYQDNSSLMRTLISRENAFFLSGPNNYIKFAMHHEVSGRVFSYVFSYVECLASSNITYNGDWTF